MRSTCHANAASFSGLHGPSRAMIVYDLWRCVTLVLAMAGNAAAHAGLGSPKVVGIVSYNNQCVTHFGRLSDIQLGTGSEIIRLQGTRFLWYGATKFNNGRWIVTPS